MAEQLSPGMQTRTGTAADVCDLAIHPGDDSILDRKLTAGKYNATFISTATTTLVKTGAGVLRAIVVGETAAGAISIYDAQTATNQKGALKASIAEGTYIFDIAFATGLTIVTAGASKITVVYL